MRALLISGSLLSALLLQGCVNSDVQSNEAQSHEATKTEEPVKGYCDDVDGKLYQQASAKGVQQICLSRDVSKKELKENFYEQYDASNHSQ